jgi:cysteine desulfurase
MDRIYLDYAAATPIDERVKEEMLRYFSKKDGLFGNPSSLHSFGQATYNALEDARARIAKAINGHHSEILFFSSATEANNFALRATAKKYKQTTGKMPHIIISAFEHPSVYQTAEDMERNGDAEVSEIPALPDGALDIEKLPSLLRENTVLVSVLYVQNEIGTVQDLKRIREIIDAEVRLLQTEAKLPYPLLHSDAAQGYLYSYDTQELGVDLMTIASYKVYGPKGAAALYVRGERTDMRDIIAPLVTGGSQEKGMRGGTQNLPAIMGFAKALELAIEDRSEERERLNELAGRFVSGLQKGIPGVELNAQRTSRSPHVLDIYFPEADNIDKALDMAGIAASTGSACLARAAQKPHTLVALGYSEERMKGSVRFSLGRQTTQEEIDEAVRRIILVHQNAGIKRSR